MFMLSGSDDVPTLVELSINNIENYTGNVPAHLATLPRKTRAVPAHRPSYLTYTREEKHIRESSSREELHGSWQLAQAGAETVRPLDDRATHVASLKKQHQKLKNLEIVTSFSPLIREEWYGDIESKYRIAFIDSKAVPFETRMYELNTFLLDGELPNGDKVLPPRPMRGIMRSVRLSTTYIREICDSAFSIVQEQFFQDGNHRTAILFIYEMLADIGIVVDVAPLKLYAIISNRMGQAQELARQQLFEIVWKNHHHTSINLNKRASRAMEVKHIQYGNTQVENIYSQLISQSKEQARLSLRNCKRHNKLLYNSLRTLHGTEQWS